MELFEQEVARETCRVEAPAFDPVTEQGTCAGDERSDTERLAIRQEGIIDAPWRDSCKDGADDFTDLADAVTQGTGSDSRPEVAYVEAAMVCSETLIDDAGGRLHVRQ